MEKSILIGSGWSFYVGFSIGISGVCGAILLVVFEKTRLGVRNAENADHSGSDGDSDVQGGIPRNPSTSVNPSPGAGSNLSNPEIRSTNNIEMKQMLLEDREEDESLSVTSGSEVASVREIRTNSKRELDDQPSVIRLDNVSMKKPSKTNTCLHKFKKRISSFATQWILSVLGMCLFITPCLMLGFISKSFTFSFLSICLFALNEAMYQGLVYVLAGVLGSHCVIAASTGQGMAGFITVL